MLKQSIKNLIVVFLLFTLHVSASRASIVTPQTSSTALGTGSIFQVDVMIDSAEQSINAVEGKISFPGEILTLKNIYDGNSIVNLWIEKPSLIPGRTEIFPQEVIFSGITPGGFITKSSLLLSLEFEAKKPGEAVISFENMRTLLNDGKGTESAISYKSLPITVSNTMQPSTNTLTDQNPPEAFEIYLAQKQNVFENRYFISFAAQDKESGIGYYEMYEGISNTVPDDATWKMISSPHALEDQKLTHYVFVRAVDKAGNKTVALLTPKNRSQKAEDKLWYLVIIVLGVLVTTAFIWFRKLNNRISHTG